MTEVTDEMLSAGWRAYREHDGHKNGLRSAYLAMRAREPAASAVSGDAVEAALDAYWGDVGWRTADDDESIKWNCMSRALAAADRARGRSYEPPLHLIEIARLRKLLQECVDFWPSAINDDLQQSTHKAAADYLERTERPRFTQALFDALAIPGMKPITPDQWFRMSGPDAIPGEGWTYGYDGCISSRYTPDDDPFTGDLGSTADEGRKAPEWTAEKEVAVHGALISLLRDACHSGLGHQRVAILEMCGKRLDVAFAPAPEPAWPPGDCSYPDTCRRNGLQHGCQAFPEGDCPHAGRAETEE